MKSYEITYSSFYYVVPMINTKIAHSVKLVLPSPVDGKRGVVLTLKAGEIVKGLVIDSFGKNQVLVSIKGQRVVADTKAAFKTGEQIVLKVDTVTPNVTFQLVRKTGVLKKPPHEDGLTQLIPKLRSRLPNKEEMKEVISRMMKIASEKPVRLEAVLGKALATRMREAIHSSVLKGEMKAGTLKEIVDKSGLLFESRFRELIDGVISEKRFLEAMNTDIKGILYEAEKIIDEKVPAAPAGMKEKVLLSQDTSKREQAVVRKEDGEVFEFLKNVTEEPEGMKKENVFVRESIGMEEKQSTDKGLIKQFVREQEGVKIVNPQGKGEGKESVIQVETVKNKMTEGLLQDVRQFIDNIEIEQILNYVAKEKNDGYCLHIPYVDQEKVETARLYVYHKDGNSGEKGKKKDRLYLVFFLSMKRLGDLRIDVTINNKVVNCKVLSTNHQVSAFIQEYSSDLVERLNSEGYLSTVGCEVKADLKDTEQSLVKEFHSHDRGLVDVVI